MDEYINTYMEFTVDGETITTRFAREGDTERTTQLLEKHGGSPADEVYGLAWGGHTADVTSRVASNPTLTKAAIAGYARGGHMGPLRVLREQYQEADPERARGFAQVKNYEFVEFCLLSSNYTKYTVPIIEGYASVGESQHLQRVLSGTCFHRNAIRLAAKSGHRKIVEDLLSKFADLTTPDGTTLLLEALEGYIAGRHFKEAAELMEQRQLHPIYATQELEKCAKYSDHSLALLLGHIQDESVRAKIPSAIKPCEREFLSDTMTLERLHEYFIERLESRNSNDCGK